MAIKVRQLKSGEFKVYNGRHVATRDEKKAFFRENTDQKLRLSKDDSKLFNSVKGGVNRAKTAARDGGEFLRRKDAWDINRAEKVGINPKKLLAEMGEVHKTTYKNFRELFKRVPEAKEVYKKLINSVELPKWMEPGIAIDVISESNSQKFFVNGNEVSRGQMINLINKNSTTIKRIFDPAGQSIKIGFVGTNEIHVRLPEPEDLEDYEDFEGDSDDLVSFLEEFGEFFQIYVSNKDKDKDK